MLIGAPAVSDGAGMWRVARDCAELDLNSSYSYALWCRDFADTSAVARMGETVVGFVIGYVRPRAAGTLMIWQIAVDAAHRGLGVASALLDDVVRRAADAGVTHLETTIAADNQASIALFTALAARRNAAVDRSPLFRPEHFADAHDDEDLFRIGPLTPAGAAVPD
ncbi:diaminobutyrate acetyltransferase [Actinomadura miaoliensis]|uniref:diaminobutyrate acetyltransferase n=1 Tax=Actinomadura miaoliensis TaxID=430685 RepID=UPI003CD07A6D